MQEKNQDLQVLKPADDMSVAHQPDPRPMQIVASLLKSGATKESVEVVEKLLNLQIRMEERDAEREFNMAFVSLQDAIKPIKALHKVPDKFGKTKFMVAKPEEILDAVNPLLAANGFSASYSMEPMEGGRIKVTLELRHRKGHMTRTPFACRIGQGPPGCTEFQADGAAATYAKIRALCNCLNITIERAFDDDPKALGTPITKEQAESIQHRVRMLLPEGKINEIKFLDYLDVKVGLNERPTLDHYMQILDKRLADAEEGLAKKEGSK